MRYETFSIRLGPKDTAGRYRTIVNAPAGQASGLFELPFSVEQFAAARAACLFQSGRAVGVERDLARPIQVTSQATPEEIGSALLEALLDGEVRTCYHESRGMAARNGVGLRVRIDFDLKAESIDG